MNRTVIFGGTGFIGIHYARKLLRENRTNEIVLADIKDIDKKYLFEDIEVALRDCSIKYQYLDVRSIETFDQLPDSVNLIANFAAIHRQPGHEHAEYFNTNIPGAENVCNYARKVGCKQIIFTSSIAVYEPTDLAKDEKCIPAPISAYGSSKLAAEYIHIAWQKEREEKHKLVIVRPGVVYGPGEGGNVTRMVKAIKGGYFAFIGNKDIRKASIYVKELCEIIDHLLYNDNCNISIANAVAPNPPSMKDYVSMVKKITGWKRFVPSIPFLFVYLFSFFFYSFYKMIGKKGPIEPGRVKKLRGINNITTTVLHNSSYHYKYNLESAFRDWNEEYKADW
jgi:nucleoside-diphosphate-sugar epimerase